MIRHLRHHEIDFEKYEICIKNSAHRKYCAEKQFLDIVTGQKWELLVFGDYQVVMPIYRVRKFGLKIIVMPLLCQQLGIFSERDDAEINDLFYRYLNKNFLVAGYSFNAKNQLGAALRKRVNFYIPAQDFEDVFAKFKPQRKKKILKTGQLGDRLSLKKQGLQSVLAFIKKYFNEDFSDKQKAEYLQILSDFHQAKLLDFYSLSIDNQLVCVLGVYKDEYSAVLLLTMNHPALMRFGGASYLISEVMREHVDTRIFDFEGSEIPAVQEFFRGFRPEAEYFPVLENSKKSILLNLYKFRR